MSKENIAIQELTFNMLSAVVDIHTGYEGPDSFRFNKNTLKALHRRGYIRADMATITRLGQEAIDHFLYVYNKKCPMGKRSGVAEVLGEIRKVEKLTAASTQGKAAQLQIH